MKFSTIALSLATAGSLVAAQPHQPHRHHHRHADRHEKRDDNVATATATAYVDQSGKPMAPGDVQAGLADGALTIVGGNQVAPAPTPTTSNKVPGNEFFAQPNTKTTSSSSTAVKTSSSAAAAASTPATNAPSGGSGGYTSTGVGSAFPDGQLSCSQFPSNYGAVPVAYLGLGGWTGVQNGNNGFANAPSGGSCSEGDFCSYACPVGYQKSQWPTNQGSLGQSVGGLQCTGGKLKLTNSALSTKLCIPGAGGVSISNTIGKPVAVCRTDYPGTEGETIPLTFDTSAGSYEIAVPDESTYYQHQGLPTSAQIYINPPGAPLEKACVWGNNGTAPNMGNWAPLNIGVGLKGGQKWLGILPNAPTNAGAPLGFKVRITGDGIAPNSCYYEYPNICSNGHCTSVLTSGAGCTASTSGSAVYEFYE